MLGRNEVEHNSQNIYYRSTVGAVEAGSKLRLGIQLRTQVQVKHVLLRIWRSRVGEKLLTLSTNDAPESDNKFYSLELTMPEKGCLMWYYFIIDAVNGTTFYGNNPEMLGGRGDVYDNAPPSYQITVYNEGAKTPDWFKHSVMYQIFPDRFCRVGDRIIPKKGAVYHASWEDEPAYYKDPDTKEIIAYDFYGGNLKGIESKLDYLKGMGISVIYLNPIFESESNHHYDTGDYHKIDPILGTNEDFRHLLDTAKAKGIRIIIDGVFSHTGSNSRYFNRQGQYDSVGAFQSQSSPYSDWYNFRSWPLDYESWWNFDTLPNVKETTPSYMDFIIRDKDSVLHHWTEEGIGGWRLDVIDELPEEFSQTFYKELKKTNPEAVMIGEVWEDASNKVAYGVPREYLCGQELDSAMNYPFREILLDYLLGRNDAGLAMRRLESLRENYPQQNFYAMMNLIGSHDRERAITLLGEAAYYEGMPAIDQVRSKLDPEHYNLGKARLMLATLFQMSYPGVPCVYYGDELGMEGFKDPTNRRPYKWEGGDTGLRSWYEQVIKLRNEHTALQTGEIMPLYAEGDVLAFARLVRSGEDVFGEKATNEIFIAAFNRSRFEERSFSFDVSDFADGSFRDMLPGADKKEYNVQRGRLNLKLAPLKGMLLQHVRQVARFKHQAGILLHPTSLPSRYGVGDFGKEAYTFIDFLHKAGQSVWQILPLGPVGFGYSPYQSPSAFAGNPLLIDIDELIEKKWITANEAHLPYASGGSFIDYERVISFKHKCLKKAYNKFQREVIGKRCEEYGNYVAFCDREAYWLDDYALFMAYKRDRRGTPWTEWPANIKCREPRTLKALAERLSDGIGLEKFMQYLFHKQWKKLHDYANAHGVSILGDMPIFISHDSADVWAEQGLFNLYKDGSPRTVAGVPPDYFSATGQLWGNPHYDWDAMREEGYGWWKRRFKKLYEMVDIVRIDHFRAFESYWEVDGKAETAINGRWVPGPGKEFFDKLKEALGDMPIVAEDLGIITDAVEELRDACGFPGMKVLHFTLHFNEHGRFGFVAPENSIVYTGTHDNNTTVGWYDKDIDDVTRAALAGLVHGDVTRPREICRRLVEFAYGTNARLVITPMQDVLGLDERYRMNMPGTVGFNWKWCLKPDYLLEADAGKLRELCESNGRLH